VVHLVNLDDLNVWVQAYEQHVILFKRVMLMAMENLVNYLHNINIHYGITSRKNVICDKILITSDICN
jgi:hypothetical protein